MATSLEATGVDRRQAGATLEAIANSIEKFAVTPERLRETIEASQQALYERIKGEMDQRFDQVNAQFAFQVVVDADFVDADCFARPGSPLVVPARTFLSQLL